MLILVSVCLVVEALWSFGRAWLPCFYTFFCAVIYTSVGLQYFLYLGGSRTPSLHIGFTENISTPTLISVAETFLGVLVFRDACLVSISSFTRQSWWSLCWLLLSPAASPCKLLLGELSPPHSLTLQGGQLLFSISRQDVSLVPTRDCSTTHSQLYSGSITSKQMAQTVSLVWHSSHIGSSYSGTTADHSCYASEHPAKPCVHC